MRTSIKLALALILLLAGRAFAAETAPIDPPSEEIKIRALKMGACINGSMVRDISLGSIDVSDAIMVPDLSSIPDRPQVKTAPPVAK